MLHSWEERLLREIELEIGRDDPRFADGLRFGDPSPPQEYRHRRLRRWLLLAAVACLLLGVWTGVTFFNLLGFATAGWVVGDWLRYGNRTRRVTGRRPFG